MDQDSVLQKPPTPALLLALLATDMGLKLGNAIWIATHPAPKVIR